MIYLEKNILFHVYQEEQNHQVKLTANISLNHDYILVYERNKNEGDIVSLDHIDDGFKYEDEFFEDLAAVTLNEYEGGKVYYIGSGADNTIMDAITNKIIMSQIRCNRI